MAIRFSVMTRIPGPVLGFVLLWTLFTVPATGAAPTATLPEELHGIRVEGTFVPLDAATIGIVESVRGSVIIRHGRGFAAYRANAGDRLYTHDVIFTLADSRIRLRLRSADVITLGENSRISVDRFEDDRQAKKKRSIFSVLRGKAMFYAVRLFRYRNIETEVRTQTAVVGVRGTKFGVQVEKAGNAIASNRTVYLADASGKHWPGRLARNEAGGQFATTVYGFDGQVAVTSTVDDTTQTVSRGENLTVGTGGAGMVTVTSPAEARRFVSETEAPPPPAEEGDGGDTAEGEGGTSVARGDSGGGTSDEGAADEGDGGEADSADEGGGEGTVLDTTTAADTSLASAETAAADASQQVTSDTNTQSVVSGSDVGYFSALLTGYNGAYNLADVYANNSRNDFGGASVKGSSIVGDGSGYITASDTATDQQSTPYLTRIMTQEGGPFDSGDLGTSRQMDNPDNASGWPTNDRLGSKKDIDDKEYMEWGFWRMSRWVPAAGVTPTYAVTDRAYYVDGQSTPDAVAAGKVGDYAGSAWGTYFTGTGGIDMVGTFSCHIDVPKNSVSNFAMTVSASGYSASITGGSGSFVGSSGEFKLDTTQGTYQLFSGVGYNAASKSCVGSLFGPDGESVGGAWAMDAGTGNNAAVGIFQGDKGGAATTGTTPATLPATPTPY